MLNYFFRKPKYPVFCDIDGHVIAAISEKTFLKCLPEVNQDFEKTYNLLDSTAEGWAFMPKHMLVSPLTFKKQWTKKDWFMRQMFQVYQCEPDLLQLVREIPWGQNRRGGCH